MDKLTYELTYCVDSVKDICARHGVSVVTVNKKIGTRAQLREHVTKDTLMTYQEIIDRDYHQRNFSFMHKVDVKDS